MVDLKELLKGSSWTPESVENLASTYRVTGAIIGDSITGSIVG